MITIFLLLFKDPVKQQKGQICFRFPTHQQPKGVFFRTFFQSRGHLEFCYGILLRRKKCFEYQLVQHLLLHNSLHIDCFSNFVIGLFDRLSDPALFLWQTTVAKHHWEPALNRQNRLLFQSLFQIDLPYCQWRLSLFRCAGAKNGKRGCVIKCSGVVKGHQPACENHETVFQTTNFSYHVENGIDLAVESIHLRFQAYGETEGLI